MAKKKLARKKAPAKLARPVSMSKAPTKDRVKITSPKKELDAVKKDIRKARNPLYAINRKIKNAPTKYYERKYKKEKKAFLEQSGASIDKLINRRTELNQRVKQYDTNKKERQALQRKVKSIEKKISRAVDDKDIKEAEHLRYQLLKSLGELDKLSEAVGIELKKTNVSEFDKENQEIGAGYEIDARSPYSIWEAIKQLNKDLEGGPFQYFIINGKRYSSASVIQITAEASAFWITSKQNTGGTPYINRYINFKSKSVKYLQFNS